MDFVTGNNSNISQLEKQTETNSTYVDEEISELEKRLPELEASVQKLLAGQLTATGLDGQIVQVDLSELIIGNTVNIAAKINQSEQVHLDEQKISLKLQQLLSDNPIYQQLVIAFKQKQEIKQEMAIAGLIPASISGEDNDDEKSLVTPAKPGFTGKLILSNYRWGLLTKKLGWLGSFLNSKWLSLLALAILFFWGGGWLLFSIFGFGGQIADNSVYNPSSSNSFTTAAPLQITTISNLEIVAPTPKKADNTQSSSRLQNGTYNNLDFEANYIVAEPIEPTNSNDNTDTPTETSITPLPTATTTVANTDNKGANGATTGSINSDDSDAERVGLPSVAAGGFNGPHGAFLAPSQLAVPALNLNVPIERAIIQEQDTFVTTTANSNAITATAIISGENSTDITATIIDATVQPKLTLTWPRPGEVSQLGAYPGELGNCIILGTQESLASLRYLQVGDEISLYDRKNNRFVYRVVPFSPAGLPERVVSPITDTWLFDQPSNLAELTIIVSMPQPQLPISYNALENGSSSGNNQTQNLTDYTSSQKLAYRAILVSYAPSSTAALAGTPVAVPIQAWQVPPIPTPTATPTPGITNAATTTSPIAISPSPSIKPVATPTINIPSKLPDTGEGGASNSRNQK